MAPEQYCGVSGSRWAGGWRMELAGVARRAACERMNARHRRDLQLSSPRGERARGESRAFGIARHGTTIHGEDWLEGAWL